MRSVFEKVCAWTAVAGFVVASAAGALGAVLPATAADGVVSPPNSSSSSPCATAEATSSGAGSTSADKSATEPSIKVSNPNPGAGGSISINGSGFTPGDCLRIDITPPKTGDSVQSKWVPVGAAGSFVTNYVVPASWKAGDVATVTATITNRPTDSNIYSTEFTVGAGDGNGTDSDDYKDVVLRWGVNKESNSGAFFGGCNFLSAGKTPDAGSSHVWQKNEGLYSAADGNVTIEKPVSKTKYVQASWDTKCKTANGKTVDTGIPVKTTGSQVVISGGEGERAKDGSVKISWQGSFSVVLYGGMTYWSATNPVLTLDKDGNGTLQATGSGYAADRNNASKWSAVPARQITLATINKVDTAAATKDHGFTTLPAYAGVKVNLATAGLQVQTGKFWGSFPQDFVDLQDSIGQAPYWYSSGGQRDIAKLPVPISVAYTPEFVLPPADVTEAGAASNSKGTDDTNSSGGSTILNSGSGSGSSSFGGGSDAGSAGSNSSDTDGSSSDGATQVHSKAKLQSQAKTVPATALPIHAPFATAKDTALSVSVASGAVGVAALLPLLATIAIRRMLGFSV